MYPPYATINDAHDFSEPYKYSIICLNDLSLLLPSIGFLFVFIALNPGSVNELKAFLLCKKSVTEAASGDRNATKTTDDLSNDSDRSVPTTHITRTTVNLRTTSFRDSMQAADDDALIKIACDSEYRHSSSVFKRSSVKQPGSFGMVRMDSFPIQQPMPPSSDSPLHP